jgi:tetratricopeptide (TPR) repeat protein
MARQITGDPRIVSASLREIFIAAAAHHRAGRLAEAEQGYRRILAADPQAPDALHMLGVLAYQTGQNAAAAELIGQAIARHGSNPAYHSNLGLALKDLGALEPAAEAFRRAIALRPDAAAAHNNLGIVFTALGRWDAALACSAKALELQPELADAHANIGHVRRQQQKLAAAIAQYRTAIRLQPDFAEAHTSLAHALLQSGEFAAGWAEYEWRWQTRSMLAGRRGFTQPQWRGEPGEGRALLIHAEQGFGDTLQFCRFAADAAARGFRVILEVQKPLVRLLRGMRKVAVIGRGESLPPFDLHAPLLSLPWALGLTLDGLPGPVPYLQPDPELAAHWRRRLGAPAGPLVGLAWAGSHTAANAAIDRRRSIAPASLAPLFQAQASFVSLQKDGPPMPAGLPLIDLMPEVTDFADTAALIANLDRVITVDTAVAHLAGALGKPVWLLNRFDSCWRWLAGRRDSPWYPGLRIYPQPAPADWETPISEIAGDLRQRVMR